MLKVYINEEEVVANQNFTIQKHMLNTPSVILNNLCPKTWCENRDYSSFYHPLDYSKCKIQDETYYPNLPGTIVSSQNASLTINDVDTTKLYELTELDGNTTQSGTPTPSSPQPINVVSGRQDINAVGKNYFNPTIEWSNDGVDCTINNQQITFDGTSTAGRTYTTVNTPIPSGTYKISLEVLNETFTPQRIWFDFYKGSTKVANPGITGTGSTNLSLPNGADTIRLGFDNNKTFDNYTFRVQIEAGNQATNWVAYEKTTTEINLGKNLLSCDLDRIKSYNTNGTWTNNVYEWRGITATANENGTTTIKGTTGSSTFLYYYYVNATNKMLRMSAGTYTFSTNTGAGTGNIVIGFRDLEGNAISGVNAIYFSGNNPATATRTINQDFQMFAYIQINANLEVSERTIALQVEKGSVATSFTPYKTPIELCKINDYKDRIFRLEGKNLFDKDTMTLSNTFVNPAIGTANGFTSVYVPCKPNTTYTISKAQETSRFFVGTTTTIPEVGMTATAISSSTTGTTKTITTGDNANYIIVMVRSSSDTLTEQQIIDGVMIEQSSTATPYEPYGEKGTWWLNKNIGKYTFTGSENFTAGAFGTNSWDLNNVISTSFDTNKLQIISSIFKGVAHKDRGTSGNNIIYTVNNSEFEIRNTTFTTKADIQNATKGTSIYYILATPTYTQITDTELISQLNALQLLEGLNNISITSGDLPGEITIHYNYQFEHTDIDLLFCGVVKNSGNISLNPREPHYSSLQILDFKTFLSEGETLDYVIYQKTILEAIQQVIGTISEYGFVLGNVNILNPDDVIGAYSTKDKTAYDVFNYIADITQSRWTTRMINENQVAIDFYDPTLMPEGTAIDYTQTFFENNLIDDIKYSYGTNNYRNKQVMTSSQVYSNISQTQTIVANGYQTQFPVEQPIGKIKSITSNGIPLTFATYNEKEMGYVADFYYNPGDTFFESKDLRTTGEVLIIEYVAIIEGRQVITNASEIERIEETTGRKGIVARYENRNDATTSLELQKIGESYIKYKGTPEIKLTIQSRKNTWEVGQRVQFNAPIDELDTEYMVRSKKINYIYNQQDTVDTLFYTYELVSSFNSETEINYFDNQRSKANGNIGEGEYISRNIDIESSADIIFYDTTTTEITLDGDNELNAILNSPFVS